MYRAYRYERMLGIIHLYFTDKCKRLPVGLTALSRATNFHRQQIMHIEAFRL